MTDDPILKRVYKEPMMHDCNVPNQLSFAAPKKSHAFLGMAAAAGAIDDDGAPIHLLDLLATAVKEVRKRPSYNQPCITCKKPTRSHFDEKTGNCQCHECWTKAEEKEQERPR